MADGVSIRVEGIEVARQALDGIAARAGDTRGLFNDIGLALVTSTQRRFETGTGPDGSPWPPSIRAIAEGGKTLIDSARLMQSISFEASDGGVDVGTNVVHAAIHQFGGTIDRPERVQTIYRHYDQRSDELSNRFVKKKRSNFAQDVKVGAHAITIPARPFLGIDDSDEERIVETVEDWLLAGSGEAARAD